MRIRQLTVGFVVGLFVVGSLLGCSSTARSALHDDVAMAPKPIATPDLAVDMVRTEGEMVQPATVPAPRRMYYSQARGWDGCCGLPCESGCSDWHVRGLVGWPFFTGDSTSMEGCYYFGVDAGWTSPCCWGVDVFARFFGAEADRNIAVAGAPNYTGTDSGEWGTIGIKATWQNSISNSKWFYYAGIGPEHYWNTGYLVEDDGFGGFAEVGIGYVLNRHWRLRAGLDIHALSTKAAQENAADDGDRRLLWVFAPNVGVEFNF